ncbi:MAG: type II toxin-antitoxin system RelE/ParE family toxin [bacterium]|jgi:toxin ParE1/3/4|nr:type II toxin-antitoxin system RelE/ParE family toxin [bacterium]
MPEYKLTREADRDLDGIWEYTNKQWGKKQANKYLNKLEERFFTLAENPYLGKPRYELAGSPMSFHCERHVIFYRNADEGIEIIRVLHESMDFPRHLN